MLAKYASTMLKQNHRHLLLVLVATQMPYSVLVCSLSELQNISNLAMTTKMKAMRNWLRMRAKVKLSPRREMSVLWELDPSDNTKRMRWGKAIWVGTVVF